MTIEDQHSLIGRLFLERKQLQSELTLLNARAGEIGANYKALGQALREVPSDVRFEGQQVEARYEASRRDVFSLRGSSEEDLRRLTDEIRQKKSRLSEIERDLS